MCSRRPTDIQTLAGSLAALILAGCAAAPPVAASPSPAESDLVGRWTVSLYFSPTAPPSSTTMEVTSVDETGTMTGTFYGTPFDSAKATLRGDVVIFALLTEDGTGPYATSGRLGAGDQIEGQTLSTGRDFIMAWTAERQEP
ncbi:MAG: hypothetical protein AAFY37_07070 [Pseudomonadota bacterium]